MMVGTRNGDGWNYGWLELGVVMAGARGGDGRN